MQRLHEESFTLLQHSGVVGVEHAHHHLNIRISDREAPEAENNVFDHDDEKHDLLGLRKDDTPIKHLRQIQKHPLDVVPVHLLEQPSSDRTHPTEVDGPGEIDRPG